MQNNNQSLVAVQNGETTPIRMVPISSSLSHLGTTVSYGLAASGSMASAGTSAFSQSSSSPSSISAGAYGQGMSGFGGQSGFSNAYPAVSASQFGLPSSGAYATFGGIVRRNATIQPSVDISETSSDIVVTAYVSNGISNDLSLNVKEDSLTISGSIWTGSESLQMSRTVALSTIVRAEAVDASLRSGVLEIRLPKMEKK